MTRDELQAFIESAYARGLTHVKTGGGLLPLENWHPYGAFSSNPGIEKFIGGFRWISANEATDFPADEKDDGGIFGVWTFEREANEGEDLLAEQTSNYYRGLGV